jgi:NADH-ubiquinone oxidoreductase chain 4
MFNRIAFGGAFFLNLKDQLINSYTLSDVSKREFFMLFTLTVFTVVLGVYPAPILDGLHYSVSTLIYSTLPC